MSDVLITPGSSKIEFKDASNNIDGTIKLDSDGNLELTSPSNGISFGDVSSDVFIGNGTDSVDLKFEVSGSITGTSGVTLTLGSSNSTLALISNNTISVTGGIAIEDYIYHSGDTNTFFGFESNDTFRVNTNGSDKFKINSSGHIILEDDNDTYIHRASANVIAIVSSGTERFRVTTGGVIIPGSLSKISGSFRIPHPLVGLSTTKDLVHSFIEGPQCDNIYRGKIDLVDGTATVNLDTKSNMTAGTFVALNRDIQCFTTNETGWTNVKGSVSGNILTITAQDNSCTDTISWMVIGERQDDGIIESNLTDSDGNLIIEPDTMNDVF